MKNQVFQTGNTFDSQSFQVGHARKVWRRIEEQLPGYGMIKNVSDFVEAGLIRSGMAIVQDASVGADDKDIRVLTWEQLLAALNDSYTAVENPSGNPKTKGYYEKDGDNYVATTDTTVTDGKTYYEKVTAAGIDSLGIIGFLQEDVPVTSSATVCTGNVIVKGEIYGYMMGDTPETAAAVAAAVKGMTQKNGLNIRVI